MSSKKPTLKELFEANSYRIKVDRYPFTDDYETILGKHEALMCVKDWLLKNQSHLASKDWGLNCALVFNELLEELKDIQLPKRSCVV